MMNFEMRIGAKPEDHLSRSIGIFPLLPSYLEEAIHEPLFSNPDLPYLRFGKVQPPEGELYSEATLFLSPGDHERRSNQQVFEVASSVAQLLQRACVKTSVNIDTNVYEIGRNRWLFPTATVLSPSSVELPKAA